MELFKISLPKNCHCLVLEDSDMRIAWFKKKLTNVKFCTSVQEFKDYFGTHPQVDFIFYDHDLGEGKGTGVEAAQFMKDKFGGTSRWAVIHSWNTVAARKMMELLPNTPHIPFGEFDVEEK